MSQIVCLLEERLKFSKLPFFFVKYKYKARLKTVSYAWLMILLKYECLIVFITLIIVSVIQIVNCKLLNQHNKLECLFYPKSLHFKQIGCPIEHSSCLYSWLSTWIIFWVTKLVHLLENCIRLVLSLVDYSSSVNSSVFIVYIPMTLVSVLKNF